MGLSYAYTGKYTSDRHEAALRNGKLTAGQMAKKLSKELGRKIYANDIKEYADEWHHSGFYKGRNGRTMGRTYFFNESSLETLKSILS